MLESDAIVYSCEKIVDSESDQRCESQHGEGYKAYYESNICTPELAAELRGEQYQEAAESQSLEVSCLTFETGEQRGCRLWDFEDAYQFCAENYGDKYLPHYTSAQCSMELADQEFGFIKSADLNQGLNAKLSEVEAIMTMIDREGLRESLGGYISFQPVIGNSFNTPVVNGLLAKLSDIKDILSRRSENKIKMTSQGAREFLEFNLRYINLVNRVHKVYAYVAHRNYRSLGSYNFSALDYLNLQLSRPVALEILAHINLKVKSVGTDKLEIYQSEQNKQMYEYIAISEPKTEVDYAKLVSFLGVRESMTNLWAVDRMSRTDFLNKRIRTCGSFMSLKGYGNLKNWPGMKENVVYDVFYTDYLEREERLVESLKNIPLLTEEDQSLFETLYNNTASIKELVNQYYQSASNFEDQVKGHFTEDLNLVNEGIENDWEQFSTYHFRTFVMPGDGVLDKERIKKRIFDEFYKRKKESLIQTYSGLYPWIKNDEFDLVEQMISNYLGTRVKSRLQSQVYSRLNQPLRSYNQKSNLARRNFQEKVEQTYLVAEKYAAYGALNVELDQSRLGVGVDVQPSSIDQLMLLFESKLSDDFNDLKLTLEKNQRLAGILSDFFSKVIEKFNSEYLEQTGFNEFELKGTRQERSLALWNALYDTAREYYRENRFEITEYAMVPEATRLARDRDEMARNPYMIQVYRDGTPVTVHINDFYAAFQEDMNLVISPWEVANQSGILFGLGHLYNQGERNTRAPIYTDGTFDRPLSYFRTQGAIRLDQVSRTIDNNALKRLYLMSLNFTKREIGNNQRLMQEQEAERREFEEDYYDGVDQLRNSQQMFARLFELFKIPMGSIANGVRNAGFRLWDQDKNKIVMAELNKAFGEAPLLRNELETEEQEEIEECVGYLCISTRTRTRTYKESRSLLEKIGYHAFENGRVNETKAKQMIRQVIYQAQDHVQNKLEKFCSADYRNYKDDDNFKEVFKTSKYLRATLTSDSGTTLANAQRIRELDEKVAKDIRSTWERLTEDYLEPTIMVLGLVTLVSVGIMFSIGSMGTAAPASLAAVSAYIGMFLSASNYVFLPLIIATTFTRVNTQFIEVPAQLKFQESLAHSQVDFAKVADYDTIDEQRRENRTASYWTLGFMPLDLYFGYTVGTQLRSALGVSGVKAYQRLTGIKLKGFSAPPASLRNNRSFRELRREFGVLRGGLRYAGQGARNLRARLPRYQALPENMIRTAPLRMGIARKLKEIRLHTRPWVLNDDIKAFRDRIKNRLTEYQKYVLDEAEVINKVKLNGRMHMNEVMEHGVRYTQLSFTIKSFFAAIREGKVLSYLGQYGDLIDDLKQVQGQLIQKKVDRLNTLVDKIDEFKNLRINDEVLVQANTELVDDLLKTLTDDEILLMEAIAKKSQGSIRELKSVFRDYRQLTQSLRPMSYLYGQAGTDMVEQQHKAMSFLADDQVFNYTYRSDSEDIVQFYEAMIRQNAFNDEASNLLRRSIEERISRLWSLDRHGRRIYH